MCVIQALQRLRVLMISTRWPPALSPLRGAAAALWRPNSALSRVCRTGTLPRLNSYPQKTRHRAGFSVDGAPGTIDLNAVASRVEPPLGRRRCALASKLCMQQSLSNGRLASTKHSIHKKTRHEAGFCVDGAPGTIRTCDRLIRSQVLYPAELQARGGVMIL